MERETLHQPLRDMLLSHLFEERAPEEYTKGNIIGFLRQRPSAPGVINAATPSDYIVTVHRRRLIRQFG